MNTSQTITVKDLNALNNHQASGQVTNLAKGDSINTVLAQGDILFDMFPSGLGVHCSDVIEQFTASCSSTIEPCVSINIILNGKLSFSLAGNCYHFDASEQPMIFANVINQPTLFSRHLKANQAVKKANITIEKSWLLARCQSEQDFAMVAQLFTAQVSVYQWSCNDEIGQLANSLIVSKLAKNVANQLIAEQTTLQLINLCLPTLLNTEVKKHKVNFVERQTTDKLATQLTQDKRFSYQLEQLLLQPNISLPKMANQLGLSISTLQRKIKANYQLTAIEYIRIKRLERAQHALVIDQLSIGETAYSAGYNHVANFVTAFKKQFGLTPAQFKKRHLMT